MKKCHACGTDKSESEFGICRSKKDGLQTQCKKCKADYRAKNRNKARETSAKWRKDNPDYKPKRNNAKRREYYRKNKTRVLSWAHSRGNRVRMDHAGVVDKFQYHGNACIYCGSSENLEIEHRIPVSRGGTNMLANLAPACRSCNASKRDMTETEYRGKLCR